MWKILENVNVNAVADLHSKILDARPPPPGGSKFFQFHAVFGKIWQNRMLAPPGELAPPLRVNPRSATVMCQLAKYGVAVYRTK